MPSLDLNWLETNLESYKDYPVFIETGTYNGDTILKVESVFQELHTIEIKKEFYNKVTQKCKSKKINFHLGDSSKLLPDICSSIKLNSIFFLDGHWSSGNTGRGDKDCPLYEELDAIIHFFKQSCIIIIDDCRLFGKGPNQKNNFNSENWEDINTETILKIVQPKIKKYYFCPSVLDNNDRLVIYLK